MSVVCSNGHGKLGHPQIPWVPLGPWAIASAPGHASGLVVGEVRYSMTPREAHTPHTPTTVSVVQDTVRYDSDLSPSHLALPHFVSLSLTRIIDDCVCFMVLLLYTY